MTEMTGYDFVMGVLSLTDFEVAPLIELAGSTETEWLEFKSATTTKIGERDKGENDIDPRWHVARAVVAMANSSGGAVIIGLRETKTPNLSIEHVSLEASGFTGDWDAFALKFDEQILFPKKGWKTGRVGTWCFKDDIDPSQFKMLKGKFQGLEIAVVLVKPVISNEKFILLEQKIGNAEGIEVLIHRREGDIGKVAEIKGVRQIVEFTKTRSHIRNELTKKLHDFKSSISDKGIKNQLEEWLYEYSKKVISTVQIDLINLRAIPLDGMEKVDFEYLSEEYEQLAIENIDNFFDSDDHDAGIIDFGLSENDKLTESKNIKGNTHNQQPKLGSIFQLTSNVPQSVILGDSGSGKTWISRQP